MAELDGRAKADIATDLQELGLSLGVKSHVECYFVENRLQTIVASGLEGHSCFETVIERYGKGAVVQDTEELSEHEWIDGGVRLRVSRIDSSCDLILSIHQ
jgi:hypothetical protein